MANGVENDGFLSWFRILFRVVGAAVPVPSLVWLCSGLFLLAPLLAEAAFLRVHDMAPSLVKKIDGEDSVVGILPEVLFGRVRDGSVSPPVQGSSVPPVVALLCAQEWVSPLLRWLLVVLVCDFVFFRARHGFWLVWVDERDFDVSFKGMLGAPVLVLAAAKGEKKADRFNLCLGLWLVLLPFQVGISSLAAATEPAFVDILKPCGWQLQPAAVAAAKHGIFTLVCGISFLKFVFSLIEESCEFTAAAASVAALVSWKHGLFFCSSCICRSPRICHLLSVSGGHFGVSFCLCAGGGDTTTPRCISPDLGVDITSLKTSSFILKDQVPFQVFVSVPGRSTAVAWVSGIVSLKEVALGLGLEEWVEERLIYAMVCSRAHDLRVNVQHTELVSNSTLQFCIRAKGGAGSRIRYPDEWTCGRCRLGGCWSTKTTCFRCGARRDLVNGIPNPQVIPPRERSFPERTAQAPRTSAPPTTRSPVRKQPAPLGWTTQFCFRSWSNWVFQRLS